MHSMAKVNQGRHLADLRNRVWAAVTLFTSSDNLNLLPSRLDWNAGKSQIRQF